MHALWHGGLTENNRSISAGNRRFFRTDMLKRRPQPIGMIETDRRDHRDIRINDIGRI